MTTIHYVLIVLFVIALAGFGIFIIIDKRKSKNDKFSKSSQEFIGIKELNTHGVLLNNNQILVFFKIKPINIAVLPTSTIEAKIYSLTNVLKNVDEFEIVCLNSAESFDDNKVYLKNRLEKEDNPVIHKLLAQDIQFLDNIQIETSTAREFLISIRFRAERFEQIITEKQRIEKVLKEQGFEAERASKREIKRILAVYFAQNVVSEYFDDFDGEGVLENKYQLSDI